MIPGRIEEYLKTIKRHLVRIVRRVGKVPGDRLDPFNRREYNIWIRNKEAKSEYIKLKYNPLISVIILMDDTDSQLTKDSVESIFNQQYDSCEIILVGDKKLKIIKNYEDNPRVKVIYRRGSENTVRLKNEALKKAEGEFIALVGRGELTENALYEVVKALNYDKKIDFIYTDEDKIDKKGVRFDPHFKPDWSPDTILGLNYISYLTVLRKKKVEEVGGFRDGYGMEQDYDLYLRILEKTNKIYHIPRVLYHAYSISKSNDKGVIEQKRKVIQDAVRRSGVDAEVEIARNAPYCYLRYVVKESPKVSIIIPTKDAAKMLDRCLKSIFSKTTYTNYEVIVMSNNSEKKETFELFDEYKKRYRNFRLMEANFEFNYPKINNIAVKESKGQYVVLLNNDTEIITPEWLEVMLGYASQKHVGVVGPQLLYGDNTIQHAGTVMGLGVASHLFVGYKEDEVVWGGRLSVPYDYNAITAACFMVSKEKWNEVGGMEEKLKVAYNDVDFNLKLRRKGYYNVFLPMVKVYHYESKTRGNDDTPEKKARFDAEQAFMYKKWANVIKRDEFYNPNFSRQAAYRLDKE